MVFGYVGIRYREAPLAVREQASFTDSKKIFLFQEMKKNGIGQCMILATCNRSEIFFFCSEDEAVTAASCFLACFPQMDLTPYMRAEQGRPAMEYLFRVAAGLESQVLGEDQILGQVVDALDFSRTMGYAGKELNKIVRDAITCAKEIKTEFGVSQKPLSVSYVGIQELKKRCSIEGAQVLVIGSGRTASLALAHICECEPEKIFVCSRDRSHAKQLKLSFSSLEIRDYSERYDLLHKCQIVISATASPHLVIKKEEAGNLSGTIILDLAAPRDVDERLSECPGVQIINLDTLQEICDRNLKERERLAEMSSPVIEKAVLSSEEWLRVSRMDDTIESLQDRCHAIVEDSFAYLDRKLVLENREKKLLKKVLNASLQRLLREPIQELKQISTVEEQDEYKKMVESLFRIER